MEKIVKVTTIDEEFQKSKVKAYVRTKKGKLERVKEYEKRGFRQPSDWSPSHYTSKRPGMVGINEFAGRLVEKYGRGGKEKMRSHLALSILQDSESSRREVAEAKKVLAGRKFYLARVPTHLGLVMFTSKRSSDKAAKKEGLARGFDYKKVFGPYTSFEDAQEGKKRNEKLLYPKEVKEREENERAR